MGREAVPVEGEAPHEQEDAPEASWRELRIAPVMTGGTSLAIWMGGATAELYRVTRASREPSVGQPGLEIYRKLLGLTRTKATVDIITGTSAGGLNGVLLAAATALDASIDQFMAIRKTWHTAGDIEKLLRPRTEANPPSLLRGDDYFVEQVSEAIKGFLPEVTADRRPDDRADPSTDLLVGPRVAPPDIDLVTTLTTITPVPRTRVDSFGVDVHEVNFAQQLRFKPAHLRAELFDKWAPKLAIAARTSASIPGVFEPSFLPTNEEDAKTSGRPNFFEQASFSGNRWAVDGGVVVNLPLTEALDRIYERTARVETRRVVLYVSPTPPGATETTADVFVTVPSLKASLTTLVAGPRAEGIANDIDEIKRRNQLVTKKIESRAALSQVDAAFDATSDLYETYKHRRAVASIEQMLDDTLGATVDSELEAVTSSLLEARMALFPRDATSMESPPSASLDYPLRCWGWGITPVDEAVSIALGMMSRAVRYEQDAERRNRLLACKAKLHVVRARVAAVRALDARYWKARFEAVAGQPANLVELAPVWYREWPYADDLNLVRGAALFEATAAPGAADAAAGALSTSPSVAELAAVVAEFPGANPGPGPDVIESEGNSVVDGSAPADTTNTDRAIVEPPDANPPTDPQIDAARDAVFEVLRGAHFAVASLLFDARIDLKEVARSITDAASIGDREAKAFASEVDGVLGNTRSVDELRKRLLAVHQLQSVLLGDLVSREQSVELMQLTSDAYNGLDPGRSSADKLAGPEMARLGAFLKPSWRANDWFWGRMDAAHSLVALLLDRDQLLREGQLGAFTTWVAGLEPPASVTTELAEVDAGDGGGSLRETTRFLTRCVQLEIARSELAWIAQAVSETTARGGIEGDGGRFRVALEEAMGLEPKGPVPDSVTNDDVAELVKNMRIGTETLGDELGSKLFNRVAARSASVAINALTGDNVGIPIVGKALRPLRAPLQAITAVVDKMASATPVGRAVGLVLAAASGAIVATRLTGADVAPGFLVAAVIVLAYLVISALVRSRFWWLATSLAVTSGIIGLTLLGSNVGDIFYSESAPTVIAKVDSGSTLVLDGDGVLRIEQGSGAGQRTDDVEVLAGSRITIRNSGAGVEGGAVERRSQSWKTWGLIHPVSILNVAVVLWGFVLLLRKRWKTLLSWWSGVAVLTVAAHWVWPEMLEGSPAGEGKKHSAVAFASTLNDYGLGIVLLLVTGWAIALALGVDVTVSTFSRKRRAAAKAREVESSARGADVARSGQGDLVGHTDADLDSR